MVAMVDSGTSILTGMVVSHVIIRSSLLLLLLLLFLLLHICITIIEFLPAAPVPSMFDCRVAAMVVAIASFLPLHCRYIALPSRRPLPVPLQCRCAVHHHRR